MEAFPKDHSKKVCWGESLLKLAKTEKNLGKGRRFLKRERESEGRFTIDLPHVYFPISSLPKTSSFLQELVAIFMK